MRSLLLLVALLSLGALASCSSHGEAPGTATLPQTDVTDLYAFVSYESGRSDFVTLIANWNPRQSPYGGPNYFPLSDQFYYEINIDHDGNGVPDLIYQFNFHSELAGNGTGIALNIGGRTLPIALKAAAPITAGDNSGLNFLEFYRLNVVTPTTSTAVTVAGTGQDFFVKPWDYVGTKTFPDYHNYSRQYYYPITLPNCATAGRVFVGQRIESFHVNLGPIFDLVNIVPIDGSSGFPGGINQSDNNNAVRYTNIVSTILEIPKACIVGPSSPVIGVWASSRSIRSNRQRARLGNPLVNELLTGLKDKDKWSRRRPSQDRNLQNYILYPTFPAILSLLFRDAVNGVLGTSFSTLAPTNFPRRDLIATMLTGIPGINYLQSGSAYAEMLRLNTSVAPTAAATQSNLGPLGGDLAGFPNGRRPGDDVIDQVLRVVMGALCYTGLNLCPQSAAVVGNVPFTDGAPVNASYFHDTWPYLHLPLPGNENYNKV